MSGLGVFIVVILGGLVYFLPTIVAWGNNNISTVVIINLFFGWTLIGWVVALVFAFSDSKPAVIIQNEKPGKYDQLQKLDDLRTKGVITTEEFIREKEKVMKG